MRLFLDANVLFTAAYSPAGRARALFELARANRCELLSSTHAIKEAVRNISSKAPAAIDDLADLFGTVTHINETDPRLVAWAGGLGLPDNDAPILGAAAAAGADALVTGDRRHFGHLLGTSPGGVEIIQPSEALARLLG